MSGISEPGRHTACLPSRAPRLSPPLLTQQSSNSIILPFREKERLRAKARHDEAQALYNARYEEKLGFARKLLTRNRPIEEIAEDTGLTYEEIDGLRAKI